MRCAICACATGLAVALALAADAPGEEAPPAVVVVTPEPIGAAASLVSTRSGDAPAPLAVESLVAAPAVRPGVRTRADARAKLQGSGRLSAGSKTDLGRTTRLETAKLSSLETKPLRTKPLEPIEVYRPVEQRPTLPPSDDLVVVGKPGPGRVPPPRRRPPPFDPTGPVILDPGPIVLDPGPIENPGPLPPDFDPSPIPGDEPGDEPEPADEPAAETEPPPDEGTDWERQRTQLVYETLRERMHELQALQAERRARYERERRAREDVQGPSALRAINLLENLHVERGVELFQTDVLQISHEVYQDNNPATGLFYYMPKRYDLAWDPEQQYAMTVIYGMAGASRDEGEVFMAARLQAGIDSFELQVAKSLLLAYLRRHAGQGMSRFRELRPVPLSSTSDIELFGGANNEFAVSQEKISVQRISGFLDSVDVSWATDVRRLLNVESLLRTDASIHGTATFHTAGQEAFSRSIPLEVSVTAPSTFGRVRFDRERGWQNRTFYPVRLHTLHALLLAPQSEGRVRRDDPVVYSWRLGDAEVPPGARVRWDAGAVPAWLDEQARLLWVDYSVDGACEPCDDRVFDEKFIPSLPTSRAVVFTTGDVFEVSGAERITVHLRSPFLDPQRSRVLQRPGVRLSADGEEYTVARLFLSDREFTEAAHEPFYEYFLEVTMRDGTTWRSPRWIPSRSLDFLLGSAGLEKALAGRPWEMAESAR